MHLRRRSSRLHHRQQHCPSAHEQGSAGDGGGDDVPGAGEDETQGVRALVFPKPAQCFHTRPISHVLCSPAPKFSMLPMTKPKRPSTGEVARASADDDLSEDTKRFIDLASAKRFTTIFACNLSVLKSSACSTRAPPDPQNATQNCRWLRDPNLRHYFSGETASTN